jgi:molybdopterin/thiamine biosynthesis adenylyltransferase
VPLTRNLGLISDQEQQQLAESTVLVAGVGGVGGRVAETLARVGVGHLVLTDPDDFAVSNLNRQAGCTHDTIGRNKAMVIAELCRTVGLGPRVDVNTDGVTPSNVAALTSGVDLVIDGTDYAIPEVGLLLADASRQANIPVVLAVEIGFGAWHTVLRPDGPGFRALMGLPRDATPEALASGALSVPLWRWIARFPSYGDPELMRDVQEQGLPAPAIAPAVELSAAMLSTAAIDVLLGRPLPAESPRICHIDARTGKVRIYKPRPITFWASVARASIATRRGKAKQGATGLTRVLSRHV